MRWQGLPIHEDKEYRCHPEQAKTDAISRPIAMPSLSMGALQYSGKAGDQPVRVWEERPAGWEYAGLSFALRMTKWGVIFC
jgi:hypothetical protein